MPSATSRVFFKSVLQEEREDARVAVQPVVRDLAVAEETHERNVAECSADHLELFGVGTEETCAAAEARVVDRAARRRIKPLLDAVEHARHVFLRTVGVPAAEHHA